MSSDAQATPATLATITYHPLTAAMRAIIERNVRHYVRLAVGAVLAVYAFAFGMTIVTTPSSQNLRDVLILAGILLPLVSFSAFIVGATVAMILRRSVHPPVYCLVSGPIHQWYRRREVRFDPDGQTIEVTSRYLVIGAGRSHEMIKLNRECQDILYELHEGAIDCLIHSNIVLEIRDASGNVLYRASGYQPADTLQ